MDALKLKSWLRDRSESRGQTTTEYMMVIAVITIAIYYSMGYFVQGFGEGMSVLTEGLATSLTTDGIRP